MGKPSVGRLTHRYSWVSPLGTMKGEVLAYL